MKFAADKLWGRGSYDVSSLVSSRSTWAHHSAFLGNAALVYTTKTKSALVYTTKTKLRYQIYKLTKNHSSTD